MLARSLFNLQSRFTLPWASWLGCRSALHPVAEIGGFVAVEKQIIRTLLLSRKGSDFHGLVRPGRFAKPRPRNAPEGRFWGAARNSMTYCTFLLVLHRHGTPVTNTIKQCANDKNWPPAIKITAGGQLVVNLQYIFLQGPLSFQPIFTRTSGTFCNNSLLFNQFCQIHFRAGKL